MSMPSHVKLGGEEDYSELYKKLNGKDFKDDALYLNSTGPIVNVISKLQGVKISGRGIADEVADQVDLMNDKITSDYNKEV